MEVRPLVMQFEPQFSELQPGLVSSYQHVVEPQHQEFAYTAKYDSTTLDLFGEVVEVKIEEELEEVWIFPEERFTQYEASDLPWCMFFGIGHRATTRRVIVFAGQVAGIACGPPTDDVVTTDIRIIPTGPVRYEYVGYKNAVPIPATESKDARQKEAPVLTVQHRV